jgi:hypothetical protein
MLVATISPALADVPHSMCVQGFLEDTSMPPNPVTGTVTFGVAVYDAAMGGNQVWPAQPGPATIPDVAVENGLFALTFGDSALDGAAFAGPRWIEFSTFGQMMMPMMPRVALRTAPYALRVPDVLQLGTLSSPGKISAFNGQPSNQETLTLEAADADDGGRLVMRAPNGANTFIADAVGVSGAGSLEIREPEGGTLRAELRGFVGGNTPTSALRLYNHMNETRVNIEGGVNPTCLPCTDTGGGIELYSASSTANDQRLTALLRGGANSSGGQIKLLNGQSPNQETIRFDAWAHVDPMFSPDCGVLSLFHNTAPGRRTLILAGDTSNGASEIFMLNGQTGNLGDDLTVDIDAGNIGGGGGMTFFRGGASPSVPNKRGVTISAYNAVGNPDGGHLALWRHSDETKAIELFGADGKILADRLILGTVLNPTFKLQLEFDSAAKPGTNTWTIASDARLKKDIEPLGGALDRLLQLRGVTFKWIEPEKHGNRTNTEIGFIAQEVEPVIPHWVVTDANGYKNLNIGGFEALAVEALRELHASDAATADRVRQQEATIVAQKEQIESLSGRIAELEVLVQRLANARN